MKLEAVYGILIPFLGTSLGAACVFFLKRSLSDAVQRSLTGFAAGVMVAASIWSLLIPAIEQSSAMGTISSRICTRRAARPRGRRAACSGQR